MPAAVQVTGLREFQKLCRDLGEKELPRRIKQANLSVAREVAAAVSAAAPLGKQDQERGRSPGRLKMATRPTATATTARVKVGEGLIYGPPVIFGWRRHHIAPHRYPYEVFERMRSQILERYNEAVVAAVQGVERG